MVSVMLLCCSSFANSAVDNFKEENSKKVKVITSKEGGSVTYYGEKSGVFKPCKGACISICKKITYPDPVSKSNNGLFNVIYEGKTFLVEKERVNFKDGSIKE